jgi:quercetin dioxygenase-like cupin family protein
MEPYIYLENAADHTPLPENGILSRTLQNDEKSKIIQFCFAPGQELSAHTAPFPATLLFVTGAASLKLGDDVKSAQPGTFVYMPPQLVHGIKAETEVVMLLTLLKK